MAEYIEREALLKSIGEIPEGHISDYDAGRFDVRQNIFEAPAADVVEVRHGYWDKCKCSVCGKVSPTIHLDMENEYKIRETTYCPNCGAKMDGKDGAE